MAAAKAVGGYIFNSQSMMADAWHSFTDLASDFLTLATVSWSTKPPTTDFPMGLGKVESLGSLGVSGMLFIGGIFMGIGTCKIIYAQFFLDTYQAAECVTHGHPHGCSYGSPHGNDQDVPGIHAAWLAISTVLGKEWLYHATMKVAHERKSSILASNAVHHRIDSLTGFIALFAVLGSNFLANAAWLDPVGGALISLMVIKTGFSNTVSAMFELADKSIDENVRHSVRKAAMAVLKHNFKDCQIEIREVTGIKSGQNYLLDLELAVPGEWTITDCIEVENALRSKIEKTMHGTQRIRIQYIPKNLNLSEKFNFI